VSSLKIGLVSSCGEEREQLAKLLENNGVELVYNIKPEDISGSHIAEEELNVWLLNIDDDSWHDAVDDLLDESEVSVFFSEPGTLGKQSHPEFWCNNLLERLYEISGVPRPSEIESVTDTEQVQSEVKQESTVGFETNEEKNELEQDTDASLEAPRPLENAIEELEVSTVGLPSEIAADLVNELESLSPVLSHEVEVIEPAEAILLNESQLAPESELEVETELEATPEPSLDFESDSENLNLEDLSDFELDDFDAPSGQLKYF